MFPFFNITHLFFLSFPPSLSLAPKSFFSPGGRGGRESRTHEILKSFLGSPHHQHMLLSSLVYSLFLELQLLPPLLFLPLVVSKVLPYSFRLLSFIHSFIDSLSHSISWKKNKNRSLTLKNSFCSNTTFCLHEWHYSPEINLAPLSIWPIQRYHPLTGIYMPACILISATNYFVFMQEIEGFF